MRGQEMWDWELELQLDDVGREEMWEFLLDRVSEYDGWEGECCFEVRISMRTFRTRRRRIMKARTGGLGTPEEAIPSVVAAAPVEAAVAKDAIGLFAAGY